MDNLELWNNVKQVPKEYLKKIEAGRLRGKSNIDPIWRYQILTEIFGPCGVGWKIKHIRFWNEPGSDGQVIAFAEIELYIKQGNDWSEPIPGIGGSMLIEQERDKEKGGYKLHTSDEGYKMAETDAISVAMKLLGVAADVYAGLYDGSKYNTRQQNKPTTTATITEPPPASSGDIPQGEHFCREHGVAFEKKTKDGQTWYSHKKDDGGFCNEPKVDPYRQVKEAAKEKGITTLRTLCQALGIQKLEEITPEAALNLISEIPAF